MFTKVFRKGKRLAALLVESVQSVEEWQAPIRVKQKKSAPSVLEWGRITRRVNSIISEKRLEDAFRILIPFSEYTILPGYGELVLKVLVRASSLGKTEMKAIISQKVIPYYKGIPQSPQGIINLMFLQVALEDFDALSESIRKFGDKLFGPDFNAMCHLAVVHLVPRVKSLDEIDLLLGMMTQYAQSNARLRPVIARMLKSAMIRAHSFGAETDVPSPLLQREVFSSFLEAKRNGVCISSNLPGTAVQWFQNAQSKTFNRSQFGSRGRRPKVLFVADGSWGFLSEVASAVERSGVEIRFLPFDLVMKAVDERRTSAFPLSMSDMLYTSGPFIPGKEEALEAIAHASPWAAELIDWCDVVFVEWWNRPAVWFSRYTPESKRLIVRLHSYEAFSIYPGFSDIGRVDHKIFIAPHISKIFAEVNEYLKPDMRKANVVPNVRRGLDVLARSTKATDARWTLGMMQYATLNKDPLFAVRVLRELLKRDRRWRLRFAGNSFQEGLDDEGKAYVRQFEEELAPIAEHIIFDGFVKDVAKWHEDVGYMLSTSHREGSHESVVEGMIGGSIPALRKWPMMAPFGAPESVFPEAPSFNSYVEMADYIEECNELFSERSAHYRQVGWRNYSGADAGQFIVDLVSNG